MSTSLDAIRELDAVQLSEILLARLRERIHYMSIEQTDKVDTLLTSAIAINRKAHNAAQTINRVPVEILSLIFRFLPDRPSPSDEDSDDDFALPPWATVTSTYQLVPILNVCTHWHNAAIATPSLWTSVHDESGLLRLNGFVSRGLRLSRALPLKIYVDTWPGWHVMQLLNPQNQDPRIEELHLVQFGHDCAGDDSLLVLLQFPAERLQQLTLWTAPWDEEETDLQGRANIFSGQNPPLEYLALHGIHWLPSRGYESLTHLQLCGQDHREFSPHWTLIELHDFLSHCSNVEEIIFMNLAPAIDPADIARCSPLTLSRLSRLSIGSVAPGIGAWLIGQLLNPAGLMIRVFKMVCNNRGLLPLLARAASVRAPTKVAMTEVGNSILFESANDTSGLSIESRVDADGRPCSDCFGWIASWWTIWDMSAITELWFCSMLPEWMRTDHARWVSMLSCLRFIFIGEAFSDFDEVLRPWFRNLSTHLPNMRALPCPGLVTLVIWFRESAPPVEEISNFVVARAMLGSPIKHLRILYREGCAFEEGLDWRRARDCLESLTFEVADTPLSMKFPSDY